MCRQFLSLFLSPNLETRLGSDPAVPQVVESSSEKNRGQTYRTDWVKHQREGPFISDEYWDQTIRRRIQPQAPPKSRRLLRAEKSDVQIEIP